MARYCPLSRGLYEKFKTSAHQQKINTSNIKKWQNKLTTKLHTQNLKLFHDPPDFPQTFFKSLHPSHLVPPLYINSVLKPQLNCTHARSKSSQRTSPRQQSITQPIKSNTPTPTPTIKHRNLSPHRPHHCPCSPPCRSWSWVRSLLWTQRGQKRLSWRGNQSRGFGSVRKASIKPHLDPSHFWKDLFSRLGATQERNHSSGCETAHIQGQSYKSDAISFGCSMW